LSNHNLATGNGSPQRARRTQRNKGKGETDKNVETTDFTDCTDLGLSYSTDYFRFLTVFSGILVYSSGFLAGTVKTVPTKLMTTM